MVVRGTLIEPLNAGAHVRVRARRRRGIQRAFRHQDPSTDRDRVAIRGRAAADASLRILTHLRIGGICIERERRVGGFTPPITHRKAEVSRDPAFDRQAPLLAGGCEHDWIETAGTIERTGWRWRRPWGATRGRKRSALLKRNERKQRTAQLLAR